MARFAEGPPALVVMSVLALELEKEVALMVLREQDARLSDEIQPADLSGGVAVSRHGLCRKQILTRFKFGFLG